MAPAPSKSLRYRCTSLPEKYLLPYRLDLNIPKRNSFEFISTLRSRNTLSTCPIIVMTAFTGRQQLERGKKLGVSGWIAKPYDIAKLLQSVNDAVEAETEKAE